MLTAGKAYKVSIYIGEGAKYHGASAYATILDFLFFRGVSGATVLKGIAGFGSDHHLHSQTTVELSEHLPVKIEFIESPEKVNQLMGKLEELCGSGMIEIQETTIAKPSRSPDEDVAEPQDTVKIEGRAKMMRIYIGESDQWNRQPLHEALVRALRANDMAGVTVYRGILGYGANRRMHKDKTFHLSHDASIMLTVVDTEEKLNAFLPILEQMVQEGLIVMSDADIIKYAHRGTSVSEDKE